MAAMAAGVGFLPAGSWAAEKHLPLIIPADFGRFYPERAQRLEVSGWVRLRCTPAADATLNDCSVVDEGPKGWSFGEAALKGVRQMRVALKGSALAKVVGQPSEFPIKFTLSDKFPAQVKAPPASVIEAARPAGVSEDAVVALICQARMAGVGALTACVIRLEGPEGLGFGQAAVNVSQASYQAALPPPPPEVALTVDLEDPTNQWATRVVSPNAGADIVWAKPPTTELLARAKAASASWNKVALICKTTPDGILQACGADAATPPAAASAAVALAEGIVLSRKVYFNVVWARP